MPNVRTWSLRSATTKPLAIMTCAGGLACFAACHVSASTTAGPAGTTGTTASGAEGESSLLLASLTSSLALSPAFTPSIHDYTVPCSAGTNTVTFAATPVPGGTVMFTRPTATTARSATFQLAEDEAAVVRGIDTTGDYSDYWVRCLPHDFPKVTVTTYPANGAATAGLYLMGNTRIAPTSGGYAMILDGNGTPVWYAHAASGSANVQRIDANTIGFMRPVGLDGTVGYGLDPSGKYELHHLDGSATEYVTATTGITDLHEFYVMANGHRILTSYPTRTGVDLTGLGTAGASSAMADCVIDEVDATGATVWTWAASEHVDPVKETAFFIQNVVGDQTIVDPFHCNSVDVDSTGNLLVSLRHTDAVFYVSRATSKILWKMGGTATSKDGAQLLSIASDPYGGFHRQHDARFQAGGHVSLYDDETALTSGARGVEYAVDTTAGRATYVWSYAAPLPSLAMGSLRLYDDGDRVIGWGYPAASPAVTMTETNASAKPVLEFSFGAGDLSYRVLKVAPDAFSLDALRMAAGGT